MCVHMMSMHFTMHLSSIRLRLSHAQLQLLCFTLQLYASADTYAAKFKGTDNYNQNRAILYAVCYIA